MQTKPELRRAFQCHNNRGSVCFLKTNKQKKKKKSPLFQIFLYNFEGIKILDLISLQEQKLQNAIWLYACQNLLISLSVLNVIFHGITQH